MRKMHKIKEALETLESLKVEILDVIKVTIGDKITNLKYENIRLEEQIYKAVNQLIRLEIENGKEQISITNSKCTKPTLCLEARSSEPLSAKIVQITKTTKSDTEKIPSLQSSTSDNEVNVSRLDFRIGKIIEIEKHPNADNLYVGKIACGEPNPRIVVSGLVKFISIEEMQNKSVVLLCNLKPTKMRGILSEAMVMCASTTEQVEILIPPSNAEPGDLVRCKGYDRKPDIQLNPKKKIFEECSPHLMVNEDLIACYKGKPLFVAGKGNIVATSLKNTLIK